MFSVAAAFSGCSKSSPPPLTVTPGANLIIINIDALRADHLGCYGYPRPTSPHIDRLSRQGLLFTRSYSSSAYTRESVSALFTGTHPSTGGGEGWLASPNPKIPGFIDILKDADYRTGLFTASVNVSGKLFIRGFHEAKRVADNFGVTATGTPLTKLAVDFVTRHQKEKFYLYLHYLDPHGPYSPSPQALKKLGVITPPGPGDIYTGKRPSWIDLKKEGFGPGDPRFENMITRYDAEIIDTDQAVGDLIDALDQLDLLKRTLIVITADHGEEFFEHGYMEHTWTLYKEVIHVPLIMVGPGINQPRKVDFAVSHADLLPTVMTMLKRPFPPADGRSLFKKNRTEIDLVDPGQPVIAETLIQHRNMLRTVIFRDWKYTAAVRWARPEDRPACLRVDIGAFERNPALHIDPWGPVVFEELFNTQTDPGEQHSLLDRPDTLLPALRKVLDQYRLAALEARKKGFIPPSINETFTEAELEQLRSLGYLL